MTNSLPRIFDGLIEALQNRVIPKIDDVSARAQAYGALDMLRNLKPRVEWAVGPLHEDVAAELALARRIGALLEGAGAPEAPKAAAEDPQASVLTGADLEALRERLDRHLCDVLHWLAAHRDALPAERAEQIERAIRDQQRVRLKREVKLTAPPLFGEISRGQ
jgi:hypothetical protein